LVKQFIKKSFAMKRIFMIRLKRRKNRKAVFAKIDVGSSSMIMAGLIDLVVV